ncbi:MAG: hypothetical protein FJZ01_10930 [Candidatus Sericytochromatia bacterium]|nr:hypothetical protein [Candidatus Tanganyikabacteria bacterium]
MGKLTAWLVAAGLLVGGCGRVQPGFSPASGSLRAQADPAADLREALARAYGDLKTLAGRVTYHELDPKDSKVKKSVATFKTDKARRWIRGFIEESDKPGSKNAETLFLNDGKITVRVKIGFVPITKTFPLDDPQVTSGRDYRLDQTDFAAMVDAVLSASASLKALGPGELGGRKVELLEVTPAGLPDASYERVGLDPATFLPVARVAFLRGAGAGWNGLATAFLSPEDTMLFSAALSGEKRDVELPPSTWRF